MLSECISSVTGIHWTGVAEGSPPARDILSTRPGEVCLPSSCFHPVLFLLILAWSTAVPPVTTWQLVLACWTVIVAEFGFVLASVLHALPTSYGIPVRVTGLPNPKALLMLFRMQCVAPPRESHWGVARVESDKSVGERGGWTWLERHRGQSWRHQGPWDGSSGGRCHRGRGGDTRSAGPEHSRPVSRDFQNHGGGS